jgi:hypothetical protein
MTKFQLPNIFKSFVVFTLLTACTVDNNDTQVQEQGFVLMEASIADIQAAYENGTLTSVELVEAYLDRIARYDKAGPGLTLGLLSKQLPWILNGKGTAHAVHYMAFQYY